MIYTEMTITAMKIAYDAHLGQLDYNDVPYIFHPYHLAEQMDDEISTVCALLHDVCEDTPTTFEDLKNMGYPDEVIEVLGLLTHEDGVEYMDYVKEIAKNPIATKVKIQDLLHNSDTTRLDIVDEYAIKRNEKYKRALEILSSVVHK